MQRDILSVEKGFESADLVACYCCQFFGRHFHFSTAEALQVREAWVGSDCYVMGFAGADRFLHDQRIACVEAAGYVGVVDHCSTDLSL